MRTSNSDRGGLASWGSGEDGTPPSAVAHRRAASTADARTERGRGRWNTQRTPEHSDWSTPMPQPFGGRQIRAAGPAAATTVADGASVTMSVRRGPGSFCGMAGYVRLHSADRAWTLGPQAIHRRSVRWRRAVGHDPPGGRRRKTSTSRRQRRCGARRRDQCTSPVILGDGPKGGATPAEGTDRGGRWCPSPGSAPVHPEW